MKVHELICALQKLDPQRIVVMAKDPEGNGYSPLSDTWLGKYDAEERDVGMEELTVEDEEAGYSIEDVMVGGERAVILCPTH
jgi:hypothetical protein